MSEEKVKICSKCKIVKPYSSFGPNKRLKSGVNSSCRACGAEYNRKRYAEDKDYRERNIARSKACQDANREKWRRYHRVRYQDRKEEYQEYHRNLPASYSTKYSRRDRELFPHKEKARCAVRYALRSGKLIKQPCAICGAGKVEAHHTDYAKPLDVMWMCKPHHTAWHRVFVPENNTYQEYLKTNSREEEK